MTIGASASASNVAAPGPARYTRVAIVLHWLIAALLVFEVGLGLRMEGLKGSAQFTVFQLHKSVGITILLLVMLRIVWRLLHRPPAIVGKRWERALANGVHAAFYAILLALPLSGWLTVSASKLAIPTLLYGTVPWPHVPGIATLPGTAKEVWREAGEFVHVNLVNLLYALLALHVAGALKHHFVDRDGELARMVPGVRTGAWREPRLLAIVTVATAAVAFGLTWGGAGSAPVKAADERPGAPGALASATAQTPEALPIDTPETAAPATEASAEADVEADQTVPSWAIQPGSRLRFRTSYSSDAITGSFATFGGDIVFDPDRLDGSKVTVTIDLGSAASGDAERDETLKGSDFFAVSGNRSAVFTAARFRKAGAERFVADGTLRLKGMTAPLALPFSLKITGDRATMRGSATIDRLAYRIGQGEFSSTAEIPAAVQVEVEIEARRK